MRAAILCLLASALTADPAHARDAVVTSFDGTPIVMHFFEATGLSPGERAPTVLVGPGYTKRGNARGDDVSDLIGAATLRAAGYNVLTWDPRGLGSSGGTVTFDSPDFEARDVSALLDYVAAQPEALLDAAGDPRAGMSGVSYGGGIQLVSAAIDQRIDALVPEGSWHSLLTSLFKDGAVKAGWLSLICGIGEASALGDGLFFGPAGLQATGTSEPLRRACLEILAVGDVSPASRQWFADRGPGALLDRVRVPTLFAQGTADALFPLSEAIQSYDVLRRNGVPVKMMWYCGGHGECLTPKGDPLHVARAALRWLDRWLKRNATIDTGPSFEWIADDGRWRSGPDFPLAAAGTQDATGEATLAISPLDSAGSGAVTHASPATINAANTRLGPLSPGDDVIGAPRLRLAYRGTAVPARTFLYAQVVDVRGGRVAGVQVTPIPVLLDGRARSVERPLEALALAGAAGTDLRLQITPGTTVYGRQLSTGLVRLQRIEASLPLVDPTRSGRPVAAAPALRTPRRLRLRVSTRRLNGRSRILVRSTLRSLPCGGTVRLKVRGARIKRIMRVKVRRNCRVRAVLRLRVRPGSRVRISARFEGNAELRPRNARSVTRRLR